MKAKMTRALDAAYAVLLTPVPLFCLYSLITLLTRNYFLAITQEIPVLFVDFRKYYSMGHLIFSNMRQSIYDPATQLAFFNSYGSAVPVKRLLYSEYPPFFFVLAAPFSLIPLAQAYIAWCAISIALAIGAIRVLAIKCNLTGNQSTILIFGMLVSVPTWQCLMLGQSSFFLVGIVAIYSWAFLSRRNTICGIMLAFSAIKPQYGLFLCMPVLATRRWRALIFAVITELLLLAAAALTIGWQNVANYPSTLMSIDTNVVESSSFHEILVSIRGPLSLFVPYSMALYISIAVTAISCMYLFRLWRRSSPDDAENRRWLLAVTISSALAFSPHTHLHDCVLIAVVAALTMDQFRPTAALTAANSWRKVWIVALLFFPLYGWLAWGIFNNALLCKFYSFLLFNLFIFVVSAVITTRTPAQQFPTAITTRDN